MTRHSQPKRPLRRSFPKPHDFAERLFAAVAARRDTPFEWGVNDCALFACDVIRDASGVDYAAPLRGRYKSARGAARVLKEFAGGGIEDAAEAIARDAGLAEVPPLMARRGDFIMVESEAGPALGVCLGEVAALMGASCMVTYPLPSWWRAWRV